MTEVAEVDVDAFRLVVGDWLQLQQLEEGIVLGRWEPALRSMRRANDELRSRGLWVSGPSSMMSVLGVARREVINCRMVRWLLDPLGRHGIGVGLVDMLAKILDFDPTGAERATVATEVWVKEARADVVLDLPAGPVVFEAKIDAGEQELQGRRLESDWPEPARLVFLTTGAERLPGTSTARERWRHLAWVDLAVMVERLLSTTAAGSQQAAHRARAAAAAWAWETKENLR